MNFFSPYIAGVTHSGLPDNRILNTSTDKCSPSKTFLGVGVNIHIMGLRKKIRSFRKKTGYAFGSPDCQNCGKSLHREKSSIKIAPEDREHDSLFTLSLASAYILLIGTTILVSGIGANFYYSGGFDSIILSGLITAAVGLIGMVGTLPFHEYRDGKEARREIEEHPLCHSCLMEENKELWKGQDEIHADYVKEADVEYE